MLLFILDLMTSGLQGQRAALLFLGGVGAVRLSSYSKNLDTCQKNKPYGIFRG